MRHKLFIFLTFIISISCFGQDSTGYWKNGNIKNSGTYSFEKYKDCCVTGYCERINKFKTGKWTYYYENGQKMAEGIYLTKTRRKKTRCKGGAKVHYGAFDKSWKFWDEQGKEIKLKVLLEKGLLTDDKKK